MLVDLVQTQTRDNVRLDGMWREPAAAAAALPVDALCLVHGTGANFYASTLLEAIASHFVPLGVGALLINTRGHDGISTAVTGRGGIRQGAAYELVDNCRHDLASWLDFLAARGCRRVGLVGHSLGAVKSIYALAQEPHPVVAALLAISPPRLSYAAYAKSSQAAQFLEAYQRATALVEQGQPDTLMEVQLPLPMAITGAGYLEKYGPDERYDYFRFLKQLELATLVLLGENEVKGSVAFSGCPELLQNMARDSRHLEFKLLPGADHFYTGKRPELAAAIESWLRTLNS